LAAANSQASASSAASVGAPVAVAAGRQGLNSISSSSSAPAPLQRPIVRSFCSGADADPQTLADEKLDLAVKAPISAETPKALRTFLDAHQSLGPDGRTRWWATLALDEEESQVEALSKALPRGGRVAPGLLDEFLPTKPARSEELLLRTLRSLGPSEGVREALRLRSAIRRAYAEVGQHSGAGFALERLDRRYTKIFELWFAPSMVQVQKIDAASSSEAVKQAATSVAEIAGASASQEGLWGSHHRCFALKHALAKPEDPPLLVAHASFVGALPASLDEVISGTGGDEKNLALLWALGVPMPTDDLDLAQALRHLGLGQVLRQRATSLLHEELEAKGASATASGPREVLALAPLRGFCDWLKSVQAWDRDTVAAEARPILKRALLKGGANFQREIQFVDNDGDKIAFRLVGSQGDLGHLEVTIGDQQPRRILRVVALEQEKVLRFLMEPGPEALQVSVPDEVFHSGDAAHVVHMAEAAGILPKVAQDALLALAYDYIIRRGADGSRSAEPVVHFHLAGGGALNAFHWRMEDTKQGLEESFGIVMSFAYRGAKDEEEAASAYLEKGLDAATFTATA